jgi:hypothetical protein
VKKSLFNGQVQDEKKKEWEEREVNWLVEANRTVNQVFKLNTTTKIRKDVIEEFFKKGDKSCHCIFDVVSKFTKDVDKLLSKFKDALLPLTYIMKELCSRESEGKIRFNELEDSNKDVEDRRKRRKPVTSKSNDDIATLRLEKKLVEKKKPVEEKKPEKKEIPILGKVEADSKMYEAQRTEDIQMEMSRRPVPSGPIITASEEQAFTTEVLATKDPKDGKL